MSVNLLKFDANGNIAEITSADTANVPGSLTVGANATVASNLTVSGSIKSPAGKVTDSAGAIYYPGGTTVLLTSDGSTINYPTGVALMTSAGVLQYPDGSTLADSNAVLYLSILNDGANSNGTAGQVLQVAANGSPVWGNSLLSLANVTASGAVKLSSLTVGSIPFVGAAGLISQDNANLFWDATNKRLGVGTSAPTSTIEVVSASTQQRYTGIPGSPITQLRRAGGTVAAPTALASGNSIASTTFLGYDGTAYRSVAAFGAIAPHVAAGVVSGRLFFSSSDTSGLLQTRVDIDELGSVHFNYNVTSFSSDNAPATNRVVIHASDSQTGDLLRLTQSDNDGGATLFAVRADGSIVVGNLAGAPVGPSVGQIYFDTGTNHFFGWNGTAWKQLDN